MLLAKDSDQDTTECVYPVCYVAMADSYAVENDIKVCSRPFSTTSCSPSSQIMKSEQGRLRHDHKEMLAKITDNSAHLSICIVSTTAEQRTADKIKQNKMLPYLVANVVEVRLRFASTCLLQLRHPHRSSTSTPRRKRQKRRAPMSISMLNEPANAPSSRPPLVKLSSSHSSVSSIRQS